MLLVFWSRDVPGRDYRRYVEQYRKKSQSVTEIRHYNSKYYIYRLIHNLLFMPFKCKINTGSLTRRLWFCPKLQNYWETVLYEVQNMLGTELELDPVSLLLGLVRLPRALAGI